MATKTTKIQVDGYDMPVTVHVHQGDLPETVSFKGAIAVDTETMGLLHTRDRLCVVQLSDGQGEGHLVQIPRDDGGAPRLVSLLSDPETVKLYHFARFDLAALQRHLGIVAGPVYCTRTASKLVRTFTDKHGLKDLCRDLIGVEISKQQQTSDWGAPELKPEQIQYAVSDVLYLHRLKERLDIMLEREGRTELAQACFDFLPTRAALDLAGWPEVDIFAH